MSIPRPNTMRIPRVGVLRVRANAKAEVDPCVTAMSSVLACWASVGYNTAGCAMVEESLRKCMDTKQTQVKNTNSINYHLGRFHKRLEGGASGRKYKGSKD